jgi:hypothetical protein
VIITNPESIERALDGETGTRIERRSAAPARATETRTGSPQTR